MAIEKLKTPKGRNKYRVRWKPTGGRKGRVVLFEKLSDAKAYQEKENVKRRTTRLGLHSIQDLKNYTARDILRSYIAGYVLSEDDEEYSDKKDLARITPLPENEFLVLWKFSERKVCNSNLYDFNHQVAEQYKKDRSKEVWKPPGSLGEGTVVSPATVRWEISRIQLAWKWARNNYPELAYLDNPWEGIEIEGSTAGTRNRGLDLDDENETENELERLLKACERCLGLNKSYLPLAIFLATDAGMRRREIIELDWEDIDFKKRRIRLKKTKIDKKLGRSGTEIFLPLKSLYLLMRHSVALLKDGWVLGVGKVREPGIQASGRVFYDFYEQIPWTGTALRQAFDAATARAKITDLRFHDLRTVANTRFELANLTMIEKNVQKGGRPGRYHGLNELLRSIEEKLDRYDNRGGSGRTMKEWEKAKNDWLKAYRKGIDAGMTEEEAEEKANADGPVGREYIKNAQSLLASIKTIPPS